MFFPTLWSRLSASVSQIYAIFELVGACSLVLV